MLTLKNLNSFYGNSQVLWDINFELSNGEIVCLLGRNGAGKTTLLKSIMGLVTHTGNIHFEQKDIVPLAAYQRPILGIGYTPQGRRLFSELTVWENLRISLNSRKLSKQQTYSVLESIYHLFPIVENRLNQVSGTLSGGEQQIVAIARALCLQPKILLLDEPTEGLMPSIIEDIRLALQRLKQNGMTILLVEQRLNLVSQIADKVVFIENGRLKTQIQKNKQQPITTDVLSQYMET